MNKPITKTEIESATELHLIPRYVIVRKMSGYDYAPVTQDESNVANDHVTARPARKGAEAALRELILIFLATFIGSVATAAIAAGIAVKIVALIH